MVYINFPPTLTEEEEILRQKYARLRKKVLIPQRRSTELHHDNRQVIFISAYDARASASTVVFEGGGREYALYLIIFIHPAVPSLQCYVHLHCQCKNKS